MDTATTTKSFPSLDSQEISHQERAIVATRRLHERLEHDLDGRRICHCVFTNESQFRHQFLFFLDEQLRMSVPHIQSSGVGGPLRCGGGATHYEKRRAQLQCIMGRIISLCKDEDQKLQAVCGCDNELELQCEVLERSIQEMQGAIDAQPALKRQATAVETKTSTASTAVESAPVYINGQRTLSNN